MDIGNGVTSFNVAEDLADPFFIGKVRATDPDDDTVTYSVSGGRVSH